MSRMAVVFVLVMLRLRTPFVRATTTCIGPQTAGELRRQLWLNGAYDKFARPAEAALAANRTSLRPAAPDGVQVQAQVYRITSVDTKDQTFVAEVMLRAIWYDWRLEYLGASAGGCFATSNTGSLTPEGEVSYSSPVVQEIWHPDIQFINLISEMPYQPQYSAFWLYPDGLVWWSQKLLIKLACDIPRKGSEEDRGMDFTNMPYDTHRCPMRLTSFRDTENLISFSFLSGTPVRMSPGARTGGVAEWEFIDVTGDSLDGALTGAWGGGHGVVWTFVLKRKPRYYEVGVLVPSTCVVCFAYLSFYLARTAVPARATVPVVAFLVLTSQSHSVTSSIPRSNDRVWLVDFLQISSYFVLWAAFCYAMCNLLTRAEARVKAARTEKKKAIEAAEESFRKRQPQIPCERIGIVANEREPSKAADAGLDISVVLSRVPTDCTMDIADELARIETVYFDSMGKVGRLLYRNRLGHIWPRDEHIDISNRFLFPVAYAFFVGVMYARLEEVP